ncbi:hypothetical protein [Phyllobacterium myrsinacearum]|uniref:SH3 domain-containing protein n=1 Tax=Phyllobacterium myrsinacearum TaxID=28101 RepID=A0A839EP95_9HYPH|nr:hypothetical protein [Phyllobacterium myrsinacearum]MBA8879236.1 hypothetical protein [Phyllobacterium myrsinacearum]
MTRYCLGLAVLTILFPYMSYAGDAPEELSGQYDNLAVSVVGEQVTGAFREYRTGNGTDDAPQFSCIFMLKGSLIDDHAAIVTWAPGDKDVIHGTLTFSRGTASLKLDQDQAGCAMTSGDMVTKPFELSKVSEGNGWVGVGMISVKKAILRSKPNAKPGRAPFVVQYDPVVILSRKEDWLEVAYFGGENPVRGWLNRSELNLNSPSP